jgi:hypothetical protein
MPVDSGDILRAYCTFVEKHKCIVCICPRLRLFFFINSEPRRTTPTAQLLIKKSEYPFLDHDSYINAALLFELPASDLSKSILLGSLSIDTRNEIVRIVEDSRYLPALRREIITSNLISN